MDTGGGPLSETEYSERTEYAVKEKAFTTHTERAKVSCKPILFRKSNDCPRYFQFGVAKRSLQIPYHLPNCSYRTFQGSHPTYLRHPIVAESPGLLGPLRVRIVSTDETTLPVGHFHSFHLPEPNAGVDRARGEPGIHMKTLFARSVKRLVRLSSAYTPKVSREFLFHAANRL